MITAQKQQPLVNLPPNNTKINRTNNGDGNQAGEDKVQNTSNSGTGILGANEGGTNAPGS